MSGAADLYQERLMDILGDHSQTYADFVNKDKYSKWKEGVYLKMNTPEIKDDFIQGISEFGKTDQKGFLQAALDKLATGFGTNPEKVAGMFLPENAVPDFNEDTGQFEVTATSASVNPSEMGGGLGGHTNTDNLFGYLTKDIDPMTIETALRDSAGTGLLDGTPEMWT
mgnify:CR=1 FL=1